MNCAAVLLGLLKLSTAANPGAEICDSDLEYDLEVCLDENGMGVYELEAYTPPTHGAFDDYEEEYESTTYYGDVPWSHYPQTMAAVND